MKNLLLTMLLLKGIIAYGQQTVLKQDTLMGKARLMIREKSIHYNPAGAFTIYQKKAEEGYAEAMNALGLLYIKGIGVDKNEQEGFKWIEKAARNGYINAWHNLGLFYQKGVGAPKKPALALSCFVRAAKGGYIPAWFNWGTMVKDGEGVPQNFELAMSIFEQGASKGSTGCIYGQGYMYYKGFGCTQDYEKAAALFKKGARRGSTGSMYMLGLSYRNGYGVVINADSASFWLTKVAALGDKRAKDELATAEAENSKPVAQKIGKVAASKSTKPIAGELPKQFLKVKQQLKRDDIEGGYTGYLIRYDWSGQNVVSKSKLSLKLNRTNDLITGDWIEKNGAQTSFQARLTDSSLVFLNSTISRTDHYHPNTPVKYEFKNAKLQLVKTADSVYLAGNLQLYSITSREPEKPIYISLVRKDNSKPVKPAKHVVSIMTDTLVLQSSIKPNADFSEFIAYPNPFAGSFTVSFTLKKEANVQATVTDMTGRIIFQELWAQQPAGALSRSIALNVPAGTYILNLSYGGQNKTTVLIKQ